MANVTIKQEILLANQEKEFSIPNITLDIKCFVEATEEGILIYAVYYDSPDFAETNGLSNKCLATKRLTWKEANFGEKGTDVGRIALQLAAQVQEYNLHLYYQEMKNINTPW